MYAYCSYMPMKRKIFFLTPRQQKRLAQLKEETELSESEHVRRALDQYFKSLNGNGGKRT